MSGFSVAFSSGDGSDDGILSVSWSTMPQNDLSMHSSAVSDSIVLVSICALHPKIWNALSEVGSAAGGCCGVGAGIGMGVGVGGTAL